MKKLSVIIPSRDEVFLTKTIDDVYAKRRSDDTEVVAVLDSNLWPGDWKEVTARHPNIVTIHNGSPIGMRGSITKGVGSAYQRGAKYIMKIDGHVMLDEGFDVKIMEDLQPNWVMVPRRKRLDADNWTLTDTHKIDIDYHYLSFPDDPNDWGGKGLNGKPWDERSRERRDKPEYEIDDEMASQGSAWAMFTDYFYELELMDEENYGPFWNESQEIFNKAWLSGGRCVVNKKTWYAHLHKGTRHGRGYKLPESWLQKGATFTKRWMYNDAWMKQTLPFSWLIEHFWPVPSWPDNWEEVLYATRKPRGIVAPFRKLKDSDMVRVTPDSGGMEAHIHPGKLTIHAAAYGVEDDAIDVTERVRELAKNGTLDAVVNNSTLTPGQNPFRGRKKSLTLTYSFDDGEHIVITRAEKDWLIIGPVSDSVYKQRPEPVIEVADVPADGKFHQVGVASPPQEPGLAMATLGGDEIPQQSPDLKIHSSDMVVLDGPVDVTQKLELMPTLSATLNPARSAAALNDYLIRRFSISPQRLRGPMPIELRDFHRNDLAQLFAELGFKRGAEIGVAEGNYSEVLLKANPECELLLVDPWHAYSDNPQNKSPEKHEFAYNEVVRKTKDYPNVEIRQAYSMDAVDGILYDSLDFVYVDACHLFDYAVMDLVEWSKRVRSGGIVSGDDYYALDQKRWVGGGVVEAVQAYVNAHRIPVWWLFEGHKSVDFMWVKP